MVDRGCVYGYIKIGFDRQLRYIKNLFPGREEHAREPESMSQATREGIVTRGHGNRFIVYSDGGYFDCRLRGRVKFKTEQTTPVAVGDDVIFTVTGDKAGVIESVKNRRAVLSRPAVGREDSEHVLAANIDVLLIVVSVKSPPLRPGLIDRFLIAARIGKLRPVIVINKIDLKQGNDIDDIAQIYGSLGYDLFLTSALDGTGLDDLRRFLKDHRSTMAGHSGVGKSSLLNRFLPAIELHTEEISRVTGKGRHATSLMQLFQLPGGGWVIDSPGIKVLGLRKAERETLDEYYPEMQPYRDLCRFTRCSHIHEPDCAVKQAVADGEISSLRYQNYCRIYESL
jgi:ribosome biogenesis GTPase